MPEYDAFGREIGEDPLDALRDATAAPLDEPAPEVVVAEREPVAGPPQFVRPRRRRLGGVAGLGLIVALLGLLLALGNVAVDEIGNDIEGLVETEEPPELQPESMIRAPNLAAALAQLQGSGLGRPLTLRAYPGRVDARLVAGNGRQSLVRVTGQHELRTLGTGKGGRARGIAYSQIDPAAPERLVRDGDAEGRTVRFVRLDRSGGWRAVFADD